MADLFERLNFIKDFFVDPCDAPWTLYAEAFGPAALEAAVTWYTPDLTNILFNAAKPTKALAKRRSQRKGKTIGKSGRFGKNGVLRRFVNFDQDDWIGKKIRGFTNFADRKISGREWALWVSYGLLERVAFWFFVIDLVTDFLFNWASLVEESKFCQARGALVVLREGSQKTVGAVGGWKPIMCEIILKQRNVSSGVSSVFVPDGARMKLVVSSTAQPIDGKDKGYQLRIIDGFGTVFAEASGTASTASPSPVTLKADLIGGRNYFIEQKVSEGFVYQIGEFSAFGNHVTGS